MNQENISQIQKKKKKSSLFYPERLWGAGIVHKVTSVRVSIGPARHEKLEAKQITYINKPTPFHTLISEIRFSRSAQELFYPSHGVLQQELQLLQFLLMAKIMNTLLKD